jgi:predicted DCC family thiol-disulfide oxidoreductase YuxK
MDALYDSACPLCMREVTFLQRRDADRGLVAFVDIVDDNYNPAEHGHVSYYSFPGSTWKCSTVALPLALRWQPWAAMPLR